MKSCNYGGKRPFSDGVVHNFLCCFEDSLIKWNSRGTDDSSYNSVEKDSCVLLQWREENAWVNKVLGINRWRIGVS